MTQFQAPGGGTWQFNPPPGWPRPAPGWVPPPNWRPDPSWPQAPAGWPFWVPVGYGPATPPGRGGRARLVLAAKLAAGVITLVAAVVGTWVALVDRPSPYTMDDWRVRANAVCERDISQGHLSVYTATLQVAQVAMDPPPQGQANPTLTQAVQSLGQFAATLRTTSADLREIPVPEQADRTDIDALIARTGGMAAFFESVSSYLVDYQTGQVDAARTQQMSVDLQTTSNTTYPAWLSAARRLGLTECAAVMGATQPPTTTSTGP